MRSIAALLMLIGGMSVAQAEAEKWGALVVAEERICPPSLPGKCALKERITARAVTGKATAEEAQEAALLMCASTGITGCRVVDTFTTCGFITTGKNLSERKLKFRFGSDPHMILAECEDGGFTCHPPMGGCND